MGAELCRLSAATASAIVAESRSALCSAISSGDMPVVSMIRVDIAANLALGDAALWRRRKAQMLIGLGAGW